MPKGTVLSRGRAGSELRSPALLLESALTGLLLRDHAQRTGAPHKCGWDSSTVSILEDTEARGSGGRQGGVLPLDAPVAEAPGDPRHRALDRALHPRLHGSYRRVWLPVQNDP